MAGVLVSSRGRDQSKENGRKQTLDRDRSCCRIQCLLRLTEQAAHIEQEEARVFIHNGFWRRPL